MKSDHIIAAVHISERMTKAREVQGLLTEYGCNIKTRLGLHETGTDACSMNGLLVLELVGNADACHELLRKLEELEGIEAKSLTFTHD